jgi:hypothetical protein
LSGLTDARLRLLVQARIRCLLKSAQCCAIPLLRDRQFADAPQVDVTFSDEKSRPVRTKEGPLSE